MVISCKVSVFHAFFFFVSFHPSLTYTFGVFVDEISHELSDVERERVFVSAKQQLDELGGGEFVGAGARGLAVVFCRFLRFLLILFAGIMVSAAAVVDSLRFWERRTLSAAAAAWSATLVYCVFCHHSCWHLLCWSDAAA